MNIRIEALVISVNMVFLVFAGIYFLYITWIQLYPAHIAHRKTAALVALAAAFGGVLGGLVYGIAGSFPADAGASGMPPSILELNFGSFGGYWGVLAAMAAIGFIMRKPSLALMDAAVTGILAGGIIARLADPFTGSSGGIHLHMAAADWFQPFGPWCLYDIGALLAVLLLIKLGLPKGASDGIATVYFLSGYGTVRLLIEFFRDTHRIYGWLTIGQFMAVIQILCGYVIYKRIMHAARQ